MTISARNDSRRGSAAGQASSAAANVPSMRTPNTHSVCALLHNANRGTHHSSGALRCCLFARSISHATIAKAANDMTCGLGIALGSITRTARTRTATVGAIADLTRQAR